MVRFRALRAFAAVSFVLLASLHFRWVLTHFSTDGYLFDSGWLAYLFASRDPLIHNPPAINALSFYAHHLSPHIYFFGAPLAALGLSGFHILALHQALFFGAFFAATWRVGTAAPHSTGSVLVVGAAVLLGALANPLFQAAAYPHYEIAMTALSSLAVAAWVRSELRLFAGLLVWLALVREDGPFFGAYVCLACALLVNGAEPQDRQRRRRLTQAALLQVAIGLIVNIAKTQLFPGFDAFAMNFSGNDWDHVSLAFVMQRARAALTNPNVAPVLLGTALLAARDLKYLLAFALMAPLYVLYMLSVRPEHGHFTLYFALPWLLPPVVWIGIYVIRVRSRLAGTLEPLVIFSVSLALAAPVHAAIGVHGNSWYVAQWAVRRRVVDLHALRQFSAGVLAATRHDPQTGDEGRACVSMGIAALVPDRLYPDDVLPGNRGLTGCAAVVLQNGGMDYESLRTRAQGSGMELIMSRDTAELWTRRR